MRRRARALLLAAAVASFGGGCERDALIGAERRANANVGGDSGDASSRADGSVRVHSCQPAPCAGHIYACGDCVDNDGDGKVDMDDPDCVGPCQNAEDTFFGSIPGQNHQPCVEDCYFDQDSGFGNDGCLWSHACDPLSVAPDYHPAGSACPYDPNAKLPRGGSCAEATASQPSQCASVCGPLTPNGCDCFGCCAIPGASTPVWLGSVDDLGNPTCDAQNVGDPTRCKPCTQVTACLNPCDTCELCFGKRTLPASCTAAPQKPDCVAPTCSTGTPCGVDCLPPCPGGQACVTGCCVPELLQ